MTAMSKNPGIYTAILRRETEDIPIDEAFCEQCGIIDCEYQKDGRVCECITLRYKLMECATECLSKHEELTKATYEDRCHGVWIRYSEIGKLVGRIPQRAALSECGINTEGWSNRKVSREFKRVFRKWIEE